MNKTWFYIVMVAAAIAIVIGYNSYRNRTEVKQVTNYATRTAEPIKRTEDKKGNSTASVAVESIPVDVYNNTKDSLISANRKLIKANNLMQATVIKLSNKNDSLFAHFKTNTDSQHSDDTSIRNEPKYPDIEYADDCIDIKGVGTDSGYAITHHERYNLSVINSYKNPGLFKSKIPVADVLVDKCGQVDTVRSIMTQKPPKKFIETRGFALGAGLLLGLILGIAK